MAHKSWERDSMSALVEASTIVRQLADPATAGYCVKAAINSAFNRLRKFNWTHNRVRDVWYARSKVSITADELTQLRRAARLAKDEQEAGNEVRELRERLARLESILISADSEFHRETIEAIRINHARLRGVVDPQK